MPEGIEDNYVDELFLKGMAHKNSFPDLHYPVMIKNTVEIIHVINSVFFQILLFNYIKGEQDSEEYEKYVFGINIRIEHYLFTATMVLSFVGYIVYCYYKKIANNDEQTFEEIFFGEEVLANIKSMLFLSMILMLVTPILGSLTVTYSDDTIIIDYASK